MLAHILNHTRTHARTHSYTQVSASADSSLKLWDGHKSTKAVDTLPGHADEVYALDWSPNGNKVASGSKDRTIKIWAN